MNTVITHFYNEEYLLPWWINHHKKLFDNGVMINYNSTDRSVEICKELCPPHWKIVDSVNQVFEAKSNDAEVKMYESMYTGFKIALTTTEFLIISTPLSVLENYMIENNINYVGTIGVCMVDMQPDVLPTHDRLLLEQKHHGMITGYTDPRFPDSNGNAMIDSYYIRYGRYYHNKLYGKYLDGRHDLNYVGDDQILNLMNKVYTLKYRYSPYNDITIKRMQTYEKILPVRVFSNDEHDEVHRHFLTTAHDLNDDADFKQAYNYCVNL
jgi:hypothetical protein